MNEYNKTMQNYYNKTMQIIDNLNKAINSHISSHKFNYNYIFDINHVNTDPDIKNYMTELNKHNKDSSLVLHYNNFLDEIQKLRSNIGSKTSRYSFQDSYYKIMHLKDVINEDAKKINEKTSEKIKIHQLDQDKLEEYITDHFEFVSSIQKR